MSNSEYEKRRYFILAIRPIRGGACVKIWDKKAVGSNRKCISAYRTSGGRWSQYFAPNSPLPAAVVIEVEQHFLTSMAKKNGAR